MLHKIVPLLFIVLVTGCATTAVDTPVAKAKFTPPAGMSAIRMESGRGSIPLIGASMWVGTIDGKDRRRFDKGAEGFSLIPAGKHEVGLGWTSSYLSSFSFITFEMKPGHTYLTYAKHIPRAIEFWIVDAETGALVDESTPLVSRTPRPF